jgi:hypothetical protein
MTTATTITASAAANTPITNTTATATPLLVFLYPSPLFTFLHVVLGVLSASVPRERNFCLTF